MYAFAEGGCAKNNRTRLMYVSIPAHPSAIYTTSPYKPYSAISLDIRSTIMRGDGGKLVAQTEPDDGNDKVRATIIAHGRLPSRSASPVPEEAPAPQVAKCSPWTKTPRSCRMCGRWAAREQANARVMLQPGPSTKLANQECIQSWCFPPHSSSTSTQRITHAHKTLSIFAMSWPEDPAGEPQVSVPILVSNPLHRPYTNTKHVTSMAARLWKMQRCFVPNCNGADSLAMLALRPGAALLCALRCMPASALPSRVWSVL